MEFIDYRSIKEYIEAVDEESAVVNALLGACFAENILCNEDYSSEIEDLMAKLNNGTREKYRLALGETIKAEVEEVYKNIDKYSWLHNILKDDKSKETLFNLVAYRLTRDVRYTARAFVEDSEQYFDEQIVKYPKDCCVFVDCGAFDGYTTASFIRRCPNYSKLFLYEPMEEQYCLCKEFANQIGEKAVVKKKGVYDKGRVLSFSAEVPGSSRVMETGDLSVEVVSLDEDIDEPIGFLKMDIEGSECEALSGCKKHIKEDSPVLTICAYHKPSDLWQIAEQILSYNSNYDIFIRHHTVGTDETVIYGIPRDRELMVSNDAYLEKADIFSLSKLLKHSKNEQNRLNNSVKYLLIQVENHRIALRQSDIERDYLRGQLDSIELRVQEILDYMKQLESAKEYFLDQIENYRTCVKEQKEQLAAVKRKNGGK